MTDAEKAAEEWFDSEFFMANTGMTYILSDEKIKRIFMAGIAWARANPEQKKAEILKSTEMENT